VKTVVNIAIQILLACALLICSRCSSGESAKEAAEDKNAAKFETPNGEQDAQFLVDAVDDSYTIIQLAEFGAEQGNRTTVGHARLILKEQKKILDDLKAYAATQVISVPATGPENLRDIQEQLREEKSEFDMKWCREMINENEKLIIVFEGYGEKADGNLRIVIDESLKILRSHNDKLQQYQDAVAVND